MVPDGSLNWETFKEGLPGALLIFILPFVLFWVISHIFPIFEQEEAH
jgi:uncharacterized RDD family membrane protein YckC